MIVPKLPNKRIAGINILHLSFALFVCFVYFVCFVICFFPFRDLFFPFRNLIIQ